MDYKYGHDKEKYDKWLENGGAEWQSKSENHPNSRFILENFQCPGDILMLSACVRDIKLWKPDYEIDVRTSCDELFDHNPNITKLDEGDPSVWKLRMNYETVHQSNQNMHDHFIHGFIKDFNEQTGHAIKLTQFKPDIHLTKEEKNTPVFADQPKKFIVINAGGKTDYKTKWWWPKAWQEVIKRCKDIHFIQIGKRDKKDTGAGQALHLELKGNNVLDKIDRTSMREVARLVYQSVGTVSVVTTIMHLAAAFDRHAAVVAGGHEPWWWERYPGHDYFHTIGRLDCCRTGGCWKKKCENINEDTDHQKCMELINPKEIAMAIHSWFE